MGKFKKNIMKNQNKMGNKTVDIEWEKKAVLQLKTEKKYNAAMEKIIDLFNNGHVDADLMIELADIYYAVQDFVRAENWSKNCLKKDKNIRAYIILANIYSQKDKIDEMAQILDSALEECERKEILTHKDALEDMLLTVELSYDLIDIEKKYPHIGQWMQQDIDKEQDIEQILPEANKVNSETTDTLAAEIEDDLLNELGINDDQESDGQVQDPMLAAQAAADSIDDLINEDENIVEKQAVSRKDESSSVIDAENSLADEKEQMQAAILQEDSSLLEKIQKLNAAAVKYYLDDDFVGAQLFLETAFSIDAYNEGTLRNLVYLSLKQDDKDSAFEYAIKMPIVDFSLLDMIKNHK